LLLTSFASLLRVTSPHRGPVRNGVVVDQQTNIAVTTVLDSGAGEGRQGLYQQIGAKSLRNKRDYCQLQGYTYRPFHGALDHARPAAWSKIRAIESCLDAGFEWVFWHDVDSFVMDMTFKLETILQADDARDLIIAHDEHSSICSGSMLVRNTEWNRTFFKKVWACTDLIDHQWWEQAAIIRMLESLDDDTRDAHVWIAPQTIMNSYPAELAKYPANFEPGHFIIHFPGNAPDKEKGRIRWNLDMAGFHFKDRAEFPDALERCGLLGAGAEIGVQKGHFSNHILSKWPGSKLYSIDPWVHQDDYRDPANTPNDEHDIRYAQTIELLKHHGERSEIIRDHSINAAERFEDKSLDFVYIDARHAYEYAVEDINTWLPKIKPGGVLAGHDYVDGPIGGCDFGVKQAVDEILGEDAITVSTDDGPFVSWFYRQLNH